MPTKDANPTPQDWHSWAPGRAGGAAPRASLAATAAPRFPISTISTISLPPMDGRDGGQPERRESPAPNGRVAITIHAAASYAFLLAPYSRELPRRDDPSDAPASAFSSLNGPPKGANKGCQLRPSTVGTLWGPEGPRGGCPNAVPCHNHICFRSLRHSDGVPA